MGRASMHPVDEVVVLLRERGMSAVVNEAVPSDYIGVAMCQK